MNAASGYEISAAKLAHVLEIVALQRDNLVMNGGLLSVEFPTAWFERVASEMPIMVARRDSRLVGYIVASARRSISDGMLSPSNDRRTTFEGRKENLNHANKLTRTHATLLKSLNAIAAKDSRK